MSDQTDVHLIQVRLFDVHLIQVRLFDVHLIQLRQNDVHLIQLRPNWCPSDSSQTKLMSSWFMSEQTDVHLIQLRQNDVHLIQLSPTHINLIHLSPSDATRTKSNQPDIHLILPPNTNLQENFL